MADGPAAGLAVVDGQLAGLAHWPPIHVARAGFLERLGRRDDAVEVYRAALSLSPPAAEADFITERINALTSDQERP